MVRGISLSTISSLIISILTGGIPHFQPLDTIYKFLFHQSLPTYLSLGFSAIGTFTLYYTLFIILILTPISCSLHTNFKLPDTDFMIHPSKEDILYLSLIYLTYIYILYTHSLLTTTTALVGILAILLPFIYRAVIYLLDQILTSVHNSCYYPLILFLLSLLVCIIVSIPYCYITRVVVS